MGKGTGFGKTILIGDQFVLYEVPAIVSSIPYETVTTVKKIDGLGWVLEDNRFEVPGYKAKKAEQQISSINRILEVMEIDVKKTPIQITLGGSLLAGSGVGASAASCVSLARALNDEFELGLSSDGINQVAWEGEFAYHGTPSGIDNTASTYGGIMLYQIKNKRKIFEKIELKSPIEVVLGNCGVTSNTAVLTSTTGELKEKDPKLFSKRIERITAQVYEIKQGLQSGDVEIVGRIMTDNHKILVNMGLSHKKLDYLCDLVLERGAFGAKLTGGGMGGYMVALTPGRDLQDAVASAMEKKGFAVIRATISSTPHAGD